MTFKNIEKKKPFRLALSHAIITPVPETGKLQWNREKKKNTLCKGVINNIVAAFNYPVQL